LPTLAHSTIRLEERRLDLAQVFRLGNLRKAWKDTVRDGLRKQDITDLHDHYDFHVNKDRLFDVMGQQVSNGTYFPKKPFVIRVEKSDGISRHLQIPTPEDAVILQTVVNAISKEILSHQPSQNSYFSRSHSRGHRTIEHLDDSFPYDWRQLWADFQTRIWEFTSVYPYVVVTDVANFFDNISLSQLRNVLSGYGAFKEVLIDFLFFMLERFVWRPDYLPFSGVGLPQINFDAPRLLAHSFLFEVDRYLDGATSGDFVRWMDDMDFGVESIDKGRVILRHLDELLLTRGVRLNSGKTKILSVAAAKDYFLPNENRYLTLLQRRIERKLERSESISDDVLLLRQRFVMFLKRPMVGNWDKVYKRYFTIASISKHAFLEKYVPQLLAGKPKLRDSIFRYYGSLGPNKARVRHIVEFIGTQSVTEDSALFNAAKLLVDWPLARAGKAHDEIVALAENLIRRSETAFIAALWILAKYATSEQLVKNLRATVGIWSQSAFLSRQVAAVTPRLRSQRGTIEIFSNLMAVSGQTDALNVVRNLDRIHNMKSAFRAELMYLQVGLRHVYPLEKFLIVLDLLNGAISDTVKKQIAATVRSLTNDPTFTYHLRQFE